MDKTKGNDVTRPRRKALVYVRQRSDEQVQLSQLSRADLLGHPRLAQHTVSLADDRIEIPEGDGPGRSAAAHYPTLQYMVGRISSGGVCLIIASDVTRICRDAETWDLLLSACATHDVQFLLGGRLIDLTQPTKLN
jgi:hypothetical protein